jgi:hypothetical protein
MTLLTIKCGYQPFEEPATPRDWYRLVDHESTWKSIATAAIWSRGVDEYCMMVISSIITRY